jgi:hypothetical protein
MSQRPCISVGTIETLITADRLFGGQKPFYRPAFVNLTA